MPKPTVNPTPNPQNTGKLIVPTGTPSGSAVPYYKVSPSDRQAAESAMERQNIPPAYRKNVESYFNGITPKK